MRWAMIAKEIEKTTQVAKGKYSQRRGIRLIAQNADDKRLIDDILKKGVEVDGVEGDQLDLRLCK
jgi:hypothetical protein